MSFFELRFVGRRFDSHVLPVAVLPELAVYQELVGKVARCHYFRNNPERRRLPRGFTSSFDLVLSEQSQGSVIAQLDRCDPPLPATIDYFEMARDDIATLYTALQAGSEEEIPNIFNDLDLVELRRFYNLGASLRADERIELAQPDGAFGERSPRIDARIRREFKRLSLDIAVEEVWLHGVIVSTDDQRHRVGIDATWLGRIDGEVDESAFPNLTQMQAEKRRITVRTRIARGEGSKARGVREQIAVVELDQESERLIERVHDLSQSREGWLDGDGARPGPRATDWTIAFLADLAMFAGVAMPAAFLLIEGGFQLEWSTSGDLEHELLVREHSREFVQMNHESGEQATLFSDYTSDPFSPHDAALAVATVILESQGGKLE